MLTDLWAVAFPDVKELEESEMFKEQRLWAMSVVAKTKQPLTSEEFKKQFSVLDVQQPQQQPVEKCTVCMEVSGVI